MNIIVVDDAEFDLKYFRIALTDAGYHVDWCRSAEEAARATEAMTVDTVPSLFIVDINMPPDGRFAGDPENRDGLRTGILLFQHIRSTLSANGLLLPRFIIFTEIQNPAILEEAEAIDPETPVLDKNAPGGIPAFLDAVRQRLKA